MHNNHRPLVPTLRVVMQTGLKQKTKSSMHGTEQNQQKQTPNLCQPHMGYHAERGNQRRPNPIHNNHPPLVPTLRVGMQTGLKQKTKSSMHGTEQNQQKQTPNPCLPGMGYHAERGNQKRPNPTHNNHHPLVPTLRVVMQTELKQTSKSCKYRELKTLIDHRMEELNYAS